MKSIVLRCIHKDWLLDSKREMTSQTNFIFLFSILVLKKGLGGKNCSYKNMKVRGEIFSV